MGVGPVQLEYFERSKSSQIPELTLIGAWRCHWECEEGLERGRDLQDEEASRRGATALENSLALSQKAKCGVTI